MLNRKKLAINACVAMGAAFWLAGCFDGGQDVAGAQPSGSPADQETEMARKIIEAEKAGVARPTRPEGFFTPKAGVTEQEETNGVRSVMETTEGTYRYTNGEWVLEKPLAKTSTSSPWGAVETGSITGLGLVAGNSGASCPSGWTRIAVDLNRRAGGKYIYLCVQSVGTHGLGLEAKDIVTFSSGKTYDGTFKLLGGSNGDMNEGAAGAYVYGTYGGMAGLCSVSGIGVQTSYVPALSPPSGWKWLLNGIDLNSGAGGDFIYLVLKVDPKSASAYSRNCAGRQSDGWNPVPMPW